MKCHNKPFPKFIYFNNCEQFAVSKKQIKSKGKIFWKKLLRVIEEPSSVNFNVSGFPDMMEVLWTTILSEEKQGQLLWLSNKKGDGMWDIKNYKRIFTPDELGNIWGVNHKNPKWSKLKEYTKWKDINMTNPIII